MAQMRAQVIYRISQQRKVYGAAQLVANSNLSDQCQSWSESMAKAGVLSHSNFNYGGEIIASGATTAEQAVQLWMNSPPHRVILLSNDYTMIGSGYADGYWTVQFG